MPGKDAAQHVPPDGIYETSNIVQRGLSVGINITAVSPYLISVKPGYSLGKTSSTRQTVKTPRIGFEKTDFTTNSSLTQANKSYMLSTLAGMSKGLLKSIDSFEFPGSNSTSSFRTASVSDSTKATAKASDGALTGSYLLNIDSLATAKTMQSSLLPANETTDLDEGSQPFSLTVNDTTYSLSINVDKSGSSPDTNRDLLEKLARAISSADSAVEASVKQTSRKVYSTLSDNLYEDVVYLSVRSSASGESTDFTLSDSTGSIVDTLRLDKVVLPGSSAQYSINSTQASSDSNTVSYDNNRLTINLLEKTGDRVSIKVQGGQTPLENKIMDIISDYNSYVNWTDNNSQSLNYSVTDEMPDDVRSIKDDLRSIGIDVSANNELKVTENFTRALQNDTDKVRTVLTGSRGLFTKITSKLNAIISNISQAYSQNRYKSTLHGSLNLFA